MFAGIYLRPVAESSVRAPPEAGVRDLRNLKLSLVPPGIEPT